MPTFSEDPRKREAEERCVEDIRKHGTHVLRVFGDDQWPEFTYTIGLFENFAHPELIVFGLPGARAHPILNLARDLIRDGARFERDVLASEVLEGYPVTFRDVPPHHRVAHFGWAEWFYGEREYSCLQMVYPSKLGPWPWDPEASPEFRANQPILETAPLPEWAKNLPG